MSCHQPRGQDAAKQASKLSGLARSKRGVGGAGPAGREARWWLWGSDIACGGAEDEELRALGNKPVTASRAVDRWLR